MLAFGEGEMASILPAMLLATFAFGTSMETNADEPVRFIGNSTAHGELRRDVLELVIAFGETDCPMPSEIRTGILNPSRVSPNASYYSPVPNTIYERWDAKFCGKMERFLVKLAPDPKGGTFVGLEYPYPPDAPSGM